LSVGALNSYRLGNLTVEGYRVEGVLGNLFRNPNDMATHLVTMLPIAVAFMFSARGLHKRLLYGALVVLLVGGTVVSFSRAGFLGLAAGTFVLAWKIGRRNRAATMLLGLFGLLAFLLLAPGNYYNRVFSIYDTSRDAVGSAGARRALLIRSIIVALRHPLFGVGIGNFHIMSVHEVVSHNAYTQVASEMGMTAMVLYTMFIVTPLRRLRQIERETFATRRGSRFYYLAVGLQASLVAYMVSSFFASVAYQWYVYYLVGYAVALRRIYTVNRDALAAAKQTDAQPAADTNLEARAESGMLSQPDETIGALAR
jgi:O-antigen ligase